MRAILQLVSVGMIAVLLGAPAFAAEHAGSTSSAATAQEECRGWGVRCEPRVMPEFCIADGKCATALPGAAIVRYDARMDAAAGR